MWGDLKTVQFGLAIAFLGFAFLLIKYRRRAIFTKNRPDLKHVPGAIPIFGNMFQMIKYQERQYEFVFANIRDLGYGWTATLPGRRFIDVSRPDWIEYIQKTNFENYPKGFFFVEATNDFWGVGIFNADGAPWYYQRKIMSHLFTVSRFKNVISSAIGRSMDSFLVVLDDLSARESEYNLSDAFYRFTLETFNRMAFGEELGLLDRFNLDKVVPVAEAFDKAHAQLDHRFNDPIFTRFFERWNAAGREMRKNIETVDNYAYGMIRSRVQQRKKNEKADHKDVLDLFLEMTHSDGTRLSEKEVRDMVLNLIIAGRDTTAAALTYTFFRLIQNPQYVDWLREEIEEHEKARGPDEELFTYDNYKSFVRANAIFYEGLRLHPSVSVNAKTVLKDDQIPNGPKVEAGSIVTWSDWAMGRDTNIWGPDAAQFKPERWIDENGKFKQASQWKYHVFNGGPRLCIGQNLATYESMLVIITLCQRYDFKFAKGYWENCEKIQGFKGVHDEAPLYRKTVVPSVKNGLHVQISQRPLMKVNV